MGVIGLSKRYSPAFSDRARPVRHNAARKVTSLRTTPAAINFSPMASSAAPWLDGDELFGRLVAFERLARSFVKDDAPAPASGSDQNSDKKSDDNFHLC